jgi:peptide/nickel transport system substrate-binding protein
VAGLVATALLGCGSASSNSSTSAASGGSSSFYTGPSPGGHPVRGGTLNISWSYSAEGFQPQIEENAGDYWLEGLVYDNLISYNAGTTTPAPDLATSWTESSDHLTYTFKLRTGVHFSNGEPVTPQAVLAFMKAITDPKSKLFQGSCCINVKSVSLTGPNTLEFRLSHPYGFFVYEMGSPPTSIIPMDYYTKVGNAYFSRHPVGSGPFKVASFTPGGAMHFVRNPYYWRTGEPYLDKVNITPTPDANLRRLSVTTGQAEAADAIPYEQLKSLRNTTGTRLLLQALSNVALVQMNETYQPLKSSAVREALSYATPRETIVTDVFHGFAQVANADFSSGPGYDPAIKQLPYDVAKAKALLKDSPYPHGFSVQVDVTGGDATAIQIASILQSSWAQIGVKATIRQLDSGTFASALLGDEAKYQIAVPPAVYWVTNTPIPSEGAQLFTNSQFAPNAFNTFYGNQTVIRTARAAEQAQIGTSQYDAQVQSLQRSSITDPSVLALAYVPSVVLAKSNVCAWGTQFNGYWPLNRVYLSNKC